MYQNMEDLTEYIHELTKVGSDQRSSTIQYDSKSKHSKRRQTVNWTWKVACWFSFSLFLKISAVTYTTACAHVRFYFWKASAQRFFRWEVVRHACARALAVHALARSRARGRPRQLGCSRSTRRQRRKVDKCRVADKKQTNKQTDKHTLLFYRYRYKCQRYQCSIHMLGLDMSKAFDTISREKLLQVMAKIVHPDELHLIHLLLYGTTLTVRQGSYTTSSFSSTVGTPQGDGLSPVLFVCYLEAALKDCRSRLPPRPASDSLIPHETGYADDINFYSTVLEWLQIALPIIARTLRMWSLNVNEAKTEWIELVSGGNWRATNNSDPC